MWINYCFTLYFQKYKSDFFVQGEQKIIHRSTFYKKIALDISVFFSTLGQIRFSSNLLRYFNYKTGKKSDFSTKTDAGHRIVCLFP
jgi:hypothetical protein